MMRKTIAWLLVLVLWSPAWANTGPPDTYNAQALYLYTKVWGFLKYHHPTVRQGCLDWDQEFLDRIGAVAAARDQDQAVASIEDSIDAIEDNPSDCEQEPPADAHFFGDVDWASDERLIGERMARLLPAFAETPVLSGPQRYVDQQPGIGNPTFQFENEFADIEEPDWQLRMLALARFWNIIEFWFPYRDVIDGDWDNALRDSIAGVIAAETRDDYVLALMALVARAQDGHANVWSEIRSRPPGGSLDVPVELRVVEGQMFVWRTASNVPTADELQFGDLVLAVDGREVAELAAEWRPYYGVSNETAFWRSVAEALLRGDTPEVEVTIERNGAQRMIRADRGEIARTGRTHDREGDTLQMLADEVAYLKLSSVTNGGGSGYIEAALGTEGFIVDIRNYPSAFMVFSLGQHFVNEATEFARFTQPDLNQPGTFRWTDPIQLQPADPHYPGKVMILVDERSQSQSEYTTMAFRASPNATVVGSQTAGADGNVSQVPLPGGLRAAISGIGVFYPDKTPTQKVGIVPDIEVKPTIAGMRAGRDEVLEVAVREILGDAIGDEELRRITRIPHAPVIEE